MGLTTRRTVRGLAGLVAVTGLVFALAVPAFASHVTPTPITDVKNPTCDDYGDWIELKADPPGNGIFTDGTLTVTISNYVQSTSDTPGSFDWESNIGVDAVLVKAGDDKHNLYVYDPEATEDDGLGPQAGSGNGISHISFCYDTGDATPTPTPTPTPVEETPTPSPTPLGEEPTPTPVDEEPTPTATVREGTQGGTPAPSGGTVPNTATSQPWTGVPASVLGLLLLASLGALVYVRLAQDPTKR